MELLIVLSVFIAVSAGIMAFTQAQQTTKLAAQARLDRITQRGEMDFGTRAALRGNRMSSIGWVQPMLEDMDFAKSVDMLLVRADWNMRVSEFIAMCATGFALGFLVGDFLLGKVLFGIVLGAFGMWAPYFILKRAAKRRIAKLEKQLPEMLVMMSNGLKAGFGLMQAVEQCARQLPSPIADELKQLRQDTQVGSSVEEAVMALNRRVGSYDLDIVITAILVQRNVGGNLSEILDNTAHTIRERERIKGEIQTLIAEQKMTGYVIMVVPPAVGVIFFFINHDYMVTLFTEPLGRLMLAAAVLMQAAGGWMIRKIVNIEV